MKANGTPFEEKDGILQCTLPVGTKEVEIMDEDGTIRKFTLGGIQ